MREAFIAGIKRVNGAKKYLFMVYALNLTLALILGAALANAIQGSLGNGFAAENLRQGFDDLWYDNFTSQARGLAASFDPSVVGFGAVLNSLDGFLRGRLFNNDTAIIGMGLLYLLFWTFCSAGFISTYAGQSGEKSFFQQSAHFFPRFVGLAVIAAILYYLIFSFVLDWLSDAVTSLTRNTIDERVAFAYTVVKYLLLLLLVWGVNMIFDYSKIHLVLRDHKNFLTAPLQAWRFVKQNLGGTIGLYLAISLVWVLLMVIYSFIAPGAGQASWLAILGVFLLGQLYLLGRIWTRCLFYSGQTALYGATIESK
jgi:hypothetical protein